MDLMVHWQIIVVMPLCVYLKDDQWHWSVLHSLMGNPTLTKAPLHTASWALAKTRHVLRDRWNEPDRPTPPYSRVTPGIKGAVSCVVLTRKAGAHGQRAPVRCRPQGSGSPCASLRSGLGAAAQHRGNMRPTENHPLHLYTLNMCRAKMHQTLR